MQDKEERIAFEWWCLAWASYLNGLKPVYAASLKLVKSATDERSVFICSTGVLNGGKEEFCWIKDKREREDIIDNKYYKGKDRWTRSIMLRLHLAARYWHRFLPNIS